RAAPDIETIARRRIDEDLGFDFVVEHIPARARAVPVPILVLYRAAGVARLGGQSEGAAHQVSGEDVVPLRQTENARRLGLLALAVRAGILPQVAAEQAQADERS